MPHKMPTETEKANVKNYLRETFANRREWIENSSPEIAEKYPRLFDYSGEMVKIISKTKIVYYLYIVYK